MSAARTLASSAEATGPSEPGSTGTPAAFMVRLASALLPMSAMVLGLGPMKVMLQASQTWANSVDSERNP